MFVQIAMVFPDTSLDSWVTRWNPTFRNAIGAKVNVMNSNGIRSRLSEFSFRVTIHYAIHTSTQEAVNHECSLPLYYMSIAIHSWYIQRSVSSFPSQPFKSRIDFLIDR